MQDETIRKLSSHRYAILYVKSEFVDCRGELKRRPVNLASGRKRGFITHCLRHQIESICTRRNEIVRASEVAKASITTLPTTGPNSTQQGKQRRGHEFRVTGGRFIIGPQIVSGSLTSDGIDCTLHFEHGLYVCI